MHSKLTLRLANNSIFLFFSYIPTFIYTESSVASTWFWIFGHVIISTSFQVLLIIDIVQFTNPVFRKVQGTKPIGERQRKFRNGDYGKRPEAIQLLVSFIFLLRIKKIYSSRAFSHVVTATILLKQWNGDHAGPKKIKQDVWDFLFLREHFQVVPINLYGCCPREWKTRIHSRCKYFHSTNPSCTRKHHSNQAKFRRRTSHEPNRMEMRKILCSPSLAFDSAHVKYGVWTWPESQTWKSEFKQFPSSMTILQLRFTWRTRQNDLNDRS